MLFCVVLYGCRVFWAMAGISCSRNGVQNLLWKCLCGCDILKAKQPYNGKRLAKGFLPERTDILLPSEARFCKPLKAPCAGHSAARNQTEPFRNKICIYADRCDISIMKCL